MKTVKDINVKDKKVIIRCDLNVPIKDGKILDDTRIKASLETINYCLDKNAKVIILAHLGRVKEKADLEKNDLAPVAERLSKLLNRKVTFVPKTRGKELEEAVANMKDKDVILIQNTRYEDLEGKKESSNDKELGEYWASLGEVFINDAFGTIHRSHASNVGIANHLPSAVGFLIEKELNALNTLRDPKHPFIVILGGAKVKDKIGVIENLVTQADKIIIGGGMAYTFLKAQGHEIGTSLLDEESIDFCTKILKKYPEKIVLPVDVVTTKEFSDTAKAENKKIDSFAKDDMGLDIGKETVKLYEECLNKAKLVVWNGPVGVYEFNNFKKGTNSILKYLVDNNIKTILGGGDVVAAANGANLKDKIFHASTGGGATLMFMEGKKLPGLEAIK